MNCKCGSTIPEKRIQLGYKTCVECSTESRWTVVPVNYHKTGNTAEVIKDPEVAADFIFQSQRKSFGVLRGMTSNRRRPVATEKPKEVKTITKPAPTGAISRYMPKYEFNEVGMEMMQILESQGIDNALKHIQKSLSDRRIFKKQADQLIEIAKQWKEN
jgi:hypothetical protein